jgi:nucleotide-binding universal stress UspA family protein
VDLAAAPKAEMGRPLMCAVRSPGRTLDFAVAEARESHRPLYVLFVRSLPVLSEGDQSRKWDEDEEAREIFSQAKARADGHPVIPCYAVSDSLADTIVDIAATTGVTQLLLGASERRGLAQLLGGNLIRQISDSLPDSIHLLVCA